MRKARGCPMLPDWTILLIVLNKGNNKITELRTILTNDTRNERYTKRTDTRNERYTKRTIHETNEPITRTKRKRTENEKRTNDTHKRDERTNERTIHEANERMIHEANERTIHVTRYTTRIIFNKCMFSIIYSTDK
jgi:hypothetical protein